MLYKTATALSRNHSSKPTANIMLAKITMLYKEGAI